MPNCEHTDAYLQDTTHENNGVVLYFTCRFCGNTGVAVIDSTNAPIEWDEEE